MEEIKITLETLYDILRNEKQKEEIQKLTESFFYDVTHYLKEKKSLLDSKQDEDDLFAAGEREKLEYELRSIKRILKEIYEKREKKIINLALNRSRTKSDIIDTSVMLREEKDFYQQLVTLLDGYREGILLNLFKGEVPFFSKPKLETLEQESPLPATNPEDTPSATPPTPEVAPTPGEEPEVSAGNDGDAKSPTPTTFTKFEEEKETATPEASPMKKIKIIHPVPSFVWKDLKEYGPWEAGEEVSIFPEVADLMIEKGRAEEIS